jgi:hypothetical protein
MAIDETGERGGPGNRRQRTVRHRLYIGWIRRVQGNRRQTAEGLRILEMGKGPMKWEERLRDSTQRGRS